jgi:hypothetical protein
MTYKAVQDRLRAAGIVISKRGNTHRINYFGGLENTAFYTADLSEALRKGLSMARPPNLSNSNPLASSALRTN